MDEECYAVPGWTILRTGLPQLPHVPARNIDSVYFQADRQLYSEPPLFFYAQAAFYAVLPNGYGTARLVSAMAGLAFLITLYALSGRWSMEPGPVLLGVGLLSLSRWFYFPAIRARPDMLCALFGLVAIYSVATWQQSRQTRWLIATGIAIGLGGLTHPFALVYATQAGCWVMLTERGWRRVATPAMLAGISLATAGLWLPLILVDPETFAVQFRNQFLHGEDGGLLKRIVFPWASLRYHAISIWDYMNPWQTLLPLTASIACGVIGTVRNNRLLILLAVLPLTAFWLMAVIVGPHHHVHGYWVYAAGFAFLGIGELLRLLLPGSWGIEKRRWIVAATGLGLVATFLPGMGLRATVEYVRRWNDRDHDSSRFAHDLIAQLPVDATYAVDAQHVVDFVFAERRALWAVSTPLYHRIEDYDFDYLVVSRGGFADGLPEKFPCELVITLGNKEDIFACYAEVYLCRHKGEQE